MSEKEDTDEEWVIESYVGNIGWSLSNLNDSPDPHTLEWCMNTWNYWKSGAREDEPLLFTEADKDRYRLRNVRTGDIIMGAIL